MCNYTITDSEVLGLLDVANTFLSKTPALVKQPAPAALREW
ncbi:hypothetical protein BKA12_000084 [Neomicrococcus lactis]|uniref:Uncharacterized protein n=1 Tax=Neomicrococcus lactis TaxID=732241 RepID=A0A7W9DA18_9MICC|nr:hypothetical protein [Neomicrococcus lactis]